MRRKVKSRRHHNAVACENEHRKIMHYRAGAGHVIAAPSVIYGKKVEYKNKKRKSVDCLKPLCWIILPITAAIIFLLDELNICELDTERLIVVGAVLIVVLLPFFAEITVKGITMKRAPSENER